MTSRTDYEAVAEEVYQTARNLLPAVQSLIEKLEHPDG